MRKITITFDGNKVTTDAQGFEGKNCVSETEKILEGLKPQLKGRKFKQEYNKIKQRESLSL